MPSAHSWKNKPATAAQYEPTGRGFSVDRRGYSVDDVCRIYDLSRQRIYLEIKSGRLPSMKVGSRRVITPAHLDAWEKACAE